MTIVEIVRQGLHYARTCRSLWLFGFVVGLASSGSNGGSGGGGGHEAGSAALGGGAVVSAAVNAAAQGAAWPWFAIVSLILLAIAAAVVLRFIGEGALIEGVVRARRGGTMTTREGFRAGWAHWGVLLRIGVLYFAAFAASVALLAVPVAWALSTLGLVPGLLIAIPAAIVGVPWLVTLTLVQAFAGRIAVLEDRGAVDAVRKARLFLHGRLLHGLKLIVATFLGTMVLSVVGFVAIVPLLLLCLALLPVLHIAAVIGIGAVVLLPLGYVFTAIVGTFRSSVWTIGYLSQVEA
jgi:hypothetical protein